MSTRTRTRSRPSGQSYTARLHQRTAAPPRARPTPPWRSSPNGPALLALAAELGHLSAALVEWPTSPIRGVVHILAAAALGLVAAAVYFGPNRLGPAAGIGIGAALPVAWVASTSAGIPPYQNYPLWIALIVAALEVTLATVLVGRWRTRTPARPAARAQPARVRRGR